MSAMRVGPERPVEHPTQPYPSVRHEPSGLPAELAIAALLALLTAALYRATSGPIAATQSGAPHFVLLADAFLHGRLWIDPRLAARLLDVTPFAGRYYVSFPPMPALLLVPFVALAGPRFNDAAFSLGLGAINIGLAYLLSRRLARPGFGRPALDLGRGAAVAIAVLLGFGTVHFYAASYGTVWFTAHIVAITFLLLYLIECAGRARPWLAGAALAAAFLARAPVISAAVFAALLARNEFENNRERLRWAVRFAVFPLVAGACLLAQNTIRFGSWLDFGYTRMAVHPALADGLRAYGQFHPHFVARNLWVLLFAPPAFDPAALSAWAGLLSHPLDLVRQLAMSAASRGLPVPVQFDSWGNGLWIVSPALVFALRPPKKDFGLFSAAWGAVLLVAAPDLLYYNTGLAQFGYRFALDFIPLLLVPVAIALQSPLSRAARIAFWILLSLSIVSNLLGLRWYFELPPY